MSEIAATRQEVESVLARMGQDPATKFLGELFLRSTQSETWQIINHLNALGVRGLGLESHNGQSQPVVRFQKPLHDERGRTHLVVSCNEESARLSRSDLHMTAEGGRISSTPGTLNGRDDSSYNNWLRQLTEERRVFNEH